MHTTTQVNAAIDAHFVDFQTAVVGRYSVVREIGRGGMGVVYLAHDVRLDRLVAIKLLPPALAAQAVARERFLREARLAARLSHPHIIPIYAVEESGAFVFYVMAYVEGETLTQRVAARGPLSTTDAVRLLREVSWALSSAHAQGIVHRDVKPDNILIDQANGRAMVVDFGIAAAVGEACATGSGTPEFMSPEQALGCETDALSDVYALGATAYFTFSGRTPFRGATVAEIIGQHVAGAVPALQGVAGRAVPRAIAQLIERCLAKNPAGRPPNAQVVADALTATLEQRRALPAPLRAFVKRDGRMDGAGTMVTLLGALVGGVALSSVTGPWTGVAAIVSAISMAPALFGVSAARRLLNVGFTQADLFPAFRIEEESLLEEREARSTRVLAAIEQLLRHLVRVAVPTSGFILVVAAVRAVIRGLASQATTTPTFIPALVLVALVTTGALTLAWLGVQQAQRDVDVRFWRAVWTGRAGRLFFAVAKRFRGTTPATPAMTHRATELSLSVAAEELFAALPKDTREALREVPALLQRLERTATGLRERLRMLADARHADALGNAASPALAVQQDTLQRQHHEAISAMETLRLHLLRLHAGAVTVQHVTTCVDFAAELSSEMHRLAEAHREVDDIFADVVVPPELSPVVPDNDTDAPVGDD